MSVLSNGRLYLQRKSFWSNVDYKAILHTVHGSHPREKTKPAFSSSKMDRGVGGEGLGMGGMSEENPSRQSEQQVGVMRVHGWGILWTIWWKRNNIQAHCGK